MRLVAIEDGGDQPRAARQVQEFVAEADQATGGNAVFQTHTAFAVRLHVDHFAFAQTQGLHHAALMLFFHVSGHEFHRLALLAVDVLEHHTRLGDGQLVALAAHVFQQDGQVQFTAAGHFKNAVLVGFLDAQGHVVLQFLLEAIPDLAAGHELAFTAGQRAGVDAEVHDQGGFVHLQHRQRCGIVNAGHGHANTDVFDTIDEHDVAGTRSCRLHAVQALEGQHLVDAPLYALAVRAFADQHVHVGLDGAGAHAAHTNAAYERRVVERGNLQLQGGIRVPCMGRHVLQNGVEQGRHVGTPLLARSTLLQAGPAVDARSVDHRKIQLLIGGAQLVEQIEGGVDHLVAIGTGFVDLIHHHDGLEAQGQRLLGHEAGLRHRAFLGVDQQHHAIHHGQRTFHFPTEVRVARGVDDVDVGAFPAHGTVLGQDGDATLALDGVVVHHGVDDFFVFGKGARLTQQLIDHGGLAVVDVGDDRNVADGRTHR